MGNDQSKIGAAPQQIEQVIDKNNSTTDERSFLKPDQTIILRTNNLPGCVVPRKRQRSHETVDRTPPKRRCREDQPVQRLPTCKGQSDKDDPTPKTEFSEIRRPLATGMSNQANRSITEAEVNASPAPSSCGLAPVDREDVAEISGPSVHSVSDSEDTIVDDEKSSWTAGTSIKSPWERRDPNQSFLASQKKTVALRRKAEAYMRARKKAHCNEGGTEFPLNGAGLWPGARIVQERNTVHGSQTELRKVGFRQPVGEGRKEAVSMLPALFTGPSPRKTKVDFRSLDSVGCPTRPANAERRQGKLSGIWDRSVGCPMGPTEWTG